MSLHVHAPKPTEAVAITDYDCPHVAGGRRCGSYHALAVLTDWYGWRVTCCSCGRSTGEAALRAPLDPSLVRVAFEAVRRAA